MAKVNIACFEIIADYKERSSSCDFAKSLTSGIKSL
jgi:hypothetical protein